MKNFQLIIGRNLLLFWKNKLNVVLSLGSIIIIMSLYFIFLRNFTLQMVGDQGMRGIEGALYADRFMVAGLLVVINTTTCFGGIQQVVKDKEEGRKKDYSIAPVEPIILALAYWFSAAIIAACYTILTFFLYEVFFYVKYANCLSPMLCFRILLSLVTASFVNAGILYCISYCIKHTSDFSTFANLYGTIAGFLAGAYLPYFFYGGLLKKILYYYPCTQLTSLIRQLYVSELNGQEIKQTNKIFGIDLYRGIEQISSRKQWSVVIISLAIILSFIAIVENMRSYHQEGGQA